MAQKIILPGQEVRVDIPNGVDPVWYEKLQALTKQVNALEAFITAGAYSEQTSWTPVLSSIGGGTVPTYTATPLNGAYARIGHLVFFGAYSNNVAGGVAGAGAFQLQLALPIPAFPGANPIRVQLGVGQNAAIENVLLGQVVGGASQMRLFMMTGASQVANFNCVDQNNAVRGLEMFGMYRCA